MPSLRLVFAGSPDAAVPSLEALVASSHTVVAVVTRKDSPKGRRGILSPTPVAEAAQRHGIPVIKANTLAGEASDAIAGLVSDLGVIVAYGGLVREPLLSEPRLGWVNLHFSVLPRWRGAAPVQRAIMAGDEITGATVFQLVPELDAGDVFGVVTHTIDPSDTAGTVLDALADSGAILLASAIDAIAHGNARAEPQSGDVTLAPKLHLRDGLIDWNADSRVIANQIRGVTPEPGASTIVDGVRLKIIQARYLGAAGLGETASGMSIPALEPGQFGSRDSRVFVGTGSDPLELVRVHPASKKEMGAGDWWRGRPAGAGTRVDTTDSERQSQSQESS
ncbi:MAG: methionyl-tRNA formyltransferase [Microbacteriaceae bacterium]